MRLVTQHQSSWVDDFDYPLIGQAETLQAPAAHFWDMHETGATSKITDVISSATITSSSLSPIPGEPYINCVADGITGQELAGGVEIGQRDFMLMAVARSKADVIFPRANGFTGFYWSGNGYTFKNHPYYAVAGQSYRTLPYFKNWIRTAGEIYTHAIVRRGKLLEHYCLPRGFIDCFDITRSNAPQHAGYIGQPTTTTLGHGGYGTPARNGEGRDFGQMPPWTFPTGDESAPGTVGQDYAGLAVYVFDGAAPGRADVVRGLRWSEREWTTKTTGKRLYPGFVPGLIN